jgi:iron complex transport system ATP-binding protein
LKLEVANATYSYNKGIPVFKDISFTIKSGDIFCILGQNGAGKSTLLSYIGGFFDLDKGVVQLDGEDLSSMSQLEKAKRIGYIPQFHTPVFPYSVMDFVLMGRTPHIGTFSSPDVEDITIAKNALEAVGLSHLIDKPYTEISGGERQLAMFARLLSQESDILLLDEPTSHLDYGNQFNILNLIESLARNGFLIIMTSHFPDHAFLGSTTVGIMKDQTFIDYGSADDVITENNLRLAYGMNVKVVFIEEANRKVCVPLKQSVPRSSFDAYVGAIRSRDISSKSGTEIFGRSESLE